MKKWIICRRHAPVKGLSLDIFSLESVLPTLHIDSWSRKWCDDGCVFSALSFVRGIMTATRDEMEDQVRMERAKRLGYEPQKELVYNSWLPYADQLDDESEKLLQQIRTNFAKAVMLKELKPGCAIWSARLIKYDSLHIFQLIF